MLISIDSRGFWFAYDFSGLGSSSLHVEYLLGCGALRNHVGSVQFRLNRTDKRIGTNEWTTRRQGASQDHPRVSEA